MAESIEDEWSKWLLERRYGNDPEQQEEVLEMLRPIRDQVLDNADLSDGEVLLDVGAGDGLIAFGALEQVGETGQILFSDISIDLLEHSRSLAKKAGVCDQCHFLQVPAQDLSGINDASVDAVTTRSVLIYVEEKQQAFNEFYRVLKNGGRLSVFEPINSFGSSGTSKQFWGYDMEPVTELANRVRETYCHYQPPESDPMLNFDERDIFSFVEKAGFELIDMELRAEKTYGSTSQWDTFINTAPNPTVPTIKEVITEALTLDEAERFVEYLRPLVETEQPMRRSAWVYLWSTK